MTKLGELGFKIALRREFVMSREMAATFYSKHRAEPFFEALISQMTSGPSLALALCSKDAVRVSNRGTLLMISPVVLQSFQ